MTFRIFAACLGVITVHATAWHASAKEALFFDNEPIDTGGQGSVGGCREMLSPSEGQGRNAWAEKWGYLLPGQAAQLNAQGLYAEFLTGCYRLASGGNCNPIIPVSGNASFVPDMMIDTCPWSDCYTPSQRILVGGAYVGIEDAAIAQSRTVTTFANGATLEEPVLGEQAVASFSSAPVSEDIYVLQGRNGEHLEVTGGHPLVLSDGTVIDARRLRKGDELASINGDPILLVDVTTYHYEGNVWNVLPKSETKIENIVIAEGFLAGSLRFQVQWGHETFRLLVRDQIDVARIKAE